MKLLLLHALPVDGRMWSRVLDAYPTAIAPDLYGLGSSVEEWASAVLDQAGTDELVVVGSSVGGCCALEVARAAPEQVAAVVVVGSKAEVNPEPELRDQAIRLLETDGLGAAWERYWAPLFGSATPAPVVCAARTWALEQDVASVVDGVRAFHNRRDLSVFAANWSRPLIGISGELDVAPAPSKTKQLATGSNRRFHLVPESGHYVNLEQPEQFAELLDRVVDDVTRS